MRRANYRVVLDACVLANHGVCDLFLRLAVEPGCTIDIDAENDGQFVEQAAVDGAITEIPEGEMRLASRGGF